MEDSETLIININENQLPVSKDTSNQVVPAADNVEKHENITYEIFEEDSNKGSFKLFDSLGYSYEVEREGVSCTSWQCVNRCKRLKCPASVRQCGNTFMRNSYKHTDAPTSNVFLMSKINISIRTVASEDLIRPASHIVQEVLHSFNLDVDSISKTKYTFLLRLANKVRQGLRPEVKKRPKIVVLKKELSDTPVKFIEIDLYNDEANSVSQVTPPEADGSYELLTDPFSKENLKLFDSSGYSYNLKKVKSPKEGFTRSWVCTIRNKHHMCMATVEQSNDTFNRGPESHSHPPKPNALILAKIDVDMRYTAVENSSRPSSWVIEHVLQKHAMDENLMPRRSESYWIKLVDQFREKLGREQSRKSTDTLTTKPSSKEDDGITYEVVEELSVRKGRKLFDSLGFSYTVRRKTELATIWSCRVTRSTSQCPVAVRQVNQSFQRNSAQHSHPPQKDSLLRAKFTIDLRRKAMERRDRTTTQIVNEVLHDYKNRGVLMPSLSKFSSLVQYVKKCKRMLRNEEVKMQESNICYKEITQPITKEEYIPSSDLPVAEITVEVKSENEVGCVLDTSDVCPLPDLKEEFEESSQASDDADIHPKPVLDPPDSPPIQVKTELPTLTKHKCFKCRFQGKRKSVLKLHDLTDHKNLYKLKCKRCGHHNKRKFRLKLERLKASKDWLLRCTKCDFCTENYKHLKQHQLQHFKANKSKCSKCLIQFDVGKCE